MLYKQVLILPKHNFLTLSKSKQAEALVSNSVELWPLTAMNVKDGNHFNIFDKFYGKKLMLKIADVIFIHDAV